MIELGREKTDRPVFNLLLGCRDQVNKNSCFIEEDFFLLLYSCKMKGMFLRQHSSQPGANNIHNMFVKKQTITRSVTSEEKYRIQKEKQDRKKYSLFEQRL